jgi:hypothetical protein
MTTMDVVAEQINDIHIVEEEENGDQASVYNETEVRPFILAIIIDLISICLGANCRCRLDLEQVVSVNPRVGFLFLE